MRQIVLQKIELPISTLKAMIEAQIKLNLEFQRGGFGKRRAMNAQHGLEEKTVAQVVHVLADFPEIKKAMLFGSRAKGTYKPGSDIDLALTGDKLDWRTIGRIDSALDDLPVPYRFSVIRLSDQTDPEVAAHIRRVGIPLFER